MLARALLPIVLVALLPVAAFASPDDGKRLYLEGQALYDAGDLAGAIALWERAYAVDPRPQILANIGQIHMQGGDHAKALAAYERLLDESPSWPRRYEVEALIRRLRKELGLPAPASRAPAPRPPEDPEVERRRKEQQEWRRQQAAKEKAQRDESEQRMLRVARELLVQPAAGDSEGGMEVERLMVLSELEMWRDTSGRDAEAAYWRLVSSVSEELDDEGVAVLLARALVRHLGHLDDVGLRAIERTSGVSPRDGDAFDRWLYAMSGSDQVKKAVAELGASYSKATVCGGIITGSCRLPDKPPAALQLRVRAYVKRGAAEWRRRPKPTPAPR